MPFVKLDIGILDSSLWIEPYGRIMFITALCMAVPYELKEPAEELDTMDTVKTGFVVPPGFYGMVRASSLGIIGRTWPHDKPDVSMDRLFEDLKELSRPDPLSRSDEFEGRRMVRVNGGFLILNFAKYRELDRTTAERSKRYRDSLAASRRDKRDATGDERVAVTHAEAEGRGRSNPTKNPSPSRKRSESSSADPWEGLPDELNTPGFREAWERYIAYRVKARLRKLLPESILEQWRKLAAHGPDVAKIAIGETIGNGWQGIFPEKIASGSSGTKLTGRAAEHARQADIHTKTSEYGI